jgi:hypothetical protein
MFPFLAISQNVICIVGTCNGGSSVLYVQEVLILHFRGTFMEETNVIVTCVETISRVKNVKTEIE